MKKLIFICGASGIGKSTICVNLNKALSYSALVDSDHCRMMNPFTFSDEQKSIVEDNMTTMLSNYLKCSTIESVIFHYGFHGPRKQIFDNIISRLSGLNIQFQIAPIILECELEENIRRARKDGRDENRIKYGLENSRELYSQYDYPRLDITKLSVDEATNKLINMIDELYNH